MILSLDNSIIKFTSTLFLPVATLFNAFSLFISQIDFSQNLLWISFYSKSPNIKCKLKNQPVLRLDIEKTSFLLSEKMLTAKYI